MWTKKKYIINIISLDFDFREELMAFALTVDMVQLGAFFDNTYYSRIPWVIQVRISDSDLNQFMGNYPQR